mgnify:CR=1 FL=1
MSSATALSWFARHELRLAWREWFAMMTGGRRRPPVIMANHSRQASLSS